MTALDTLLTRLGEENAGSRLDRLEISVMESLRERRERSVARRGYVLAGCLAVIVGAASSVMPGPPVSADPLMGVPSAAPSHLLAD